MSAYATYQDVQARMTRTLSETEQSVCTTLLEDAATMIDSYKSTADDDVKALVSCRMVIRALGSGDTDVPVGATQGSMSGLGYAQSWTVASGGSTGQLYIEAKEFQLLGVRNKIGSYSPVQELAPTPTDSEIVSA